MSQTPDEYRLWALKRWRRGAWAPSPDGLRSRRGARAVEWLAQRGLLERDPVHRLLRITTAGISALATKTLPA